MYRGCDKATGFREVICPICGGQGEIMDPNHWKADNSDNRYMVCPFCFGVGMISDEKYRDYKRI